MNSPHHRTCRTWSQQVASCSKESAITGHLDIPTLQLKKLAELAVCSYCLFSCRKGLRTSGYHQPPKQLPGLSAEGTFPMNSESRRTDALLLGTPCLFKARVFLPTHLVTGPQVVLLRQIHCSPFKTPDDPCHLGYKHHQSVCLLLVMNCTCFLDTVWPSL